MPARWTWEHARRRPHHRGRLRRLRGRRLHLEPGVRRGRPPCSDVSSCGVVRFYVVVGHAHGRQLAAAIDRSRRSAATGEPVRRYARSNASKQASECRRTDPTTWPVMVDGFDDAIHAAAPAFRLEQVGRVFPCPVKRPREVLVVREPVIHGAPADAARATRLSHRATRGERCQKRGLAGYGAREGPSPEAHRDGRSSRWSEHAIRCVSRWRLHVQVLRLWSLRPWAVLGPRPLIAIVGACIEPSSTAVPLMREASNGFSTT